MQVLGILFDIPVFVFLSEFLIVAHRMTAVNGKLRMMPVNERMIEAHMQPFFTEGLNHRFQKILAVGGIGYLVVGIL